MQISLPRALFSISTKETSVAYRQFRVKNPQVGKRLEKIGATFLYGYHAALDDAEPSSLSHRLEAVEPELEGFAYEGAAMALTLLDCLLPWRRDRLRSFLAGPGAAHTYMVHVGVGWALARIPWRVQYPPQNPQLGLDPLLRWLVIDGYGFHAGYFNWSRSIKQQIRPRKLDGYPAKVFDQGLGRSLWFVEGANVDQIPQTIATFPMHRQPDLWSGVGLACAYAGGVDEQQIDTLLAQSGSYQPHLAQGAAFAAKARQRAGNPTPHTTLACEILCQRSVTSAAKITDEALINLPMGANETKMQSETEPVYEVWRQRIQEQVAHCYT